MSIVDGCPAFTESCPFAKIDTNLVAVLLESLPREIGEKCPVFKEGCPFKDTESVETLYNQLSDMPITHQPNQNNAAAKAVEETLRLVHQKSVELKSKFNATCPVFATSCPFKTVTSYGSPLVAELDGILERWGLLESALCEVGRPRTRSEEIALESSGVDIDDIPGSEPLSKSLKSGTRLVHRSAENVHFVRDFLKGTVTKENYIELLRALYHVYHAMEAGLRELPGHLKHCDFSLVERAETLEADLRYYLGTHADEAVDFGTPSPAAQQYVDQLLLLSKEDPLMLLAHAYTRYLGDLSGGQILARSAAKAYGLPEGKGACFYTFERIGTSPTDVKAFKKSYRSSLDALQLSARRADALVQEANKAFLMNILLFEERDVAGGYLERIRTLDEISQLVKTNMSPLEFQRAYGDAPEVVAQCPFIPGPAGQRKAGDPSFHGEAGAVCPWPFIWVHDPKSALSHPVKNLVGCVAMFGLFRAAWEHPRTSFAVFGMTALTFRHMKPKMQYLRDSAP